MDSQGNLKFPLECHYRIIAEDLAGIEKEIQNVLYRMGVRQPLEKGRYSSEGRYLSFNVSVLVTSKEMMNNIDEELRKIDGVKMIL